MNAAVVDQHEEESDHEDVLSVEKRLMEWAAGSPIVRCFPEQSMAYRVMMEGEAALIHTGLHSDGGMFAMLQRQGRVLSAANRVHEMQRLIGCMPADYQLCIAVKYKLKLRHRKDAAARLGWTVDRWRMTCARMVGWLEARL